MTRPIEGVGTAVAAFLGSAGDGPIGDPVDIDVDGWGTDEDAIWGDLHASPLRRALRSFFDNLGQMDALANPLVTPSLSREPELEKIRYFGDYELLEEIARIAEFLRIDVPDELTAMAAGASR